MITILTASELTVLLQCFTSIMVSSQAHGHLTCMAAMRILTQSNFLRLWTNILLNVATSWHMECSIITERISCSRSIMMISGRKHLWIWCQAVMRRHICQISRLHLDSCMHIREARCLQQDRMQDLRNSCRSLISSMRKMRLYMSLTMTLMDLCGSRILIRKRLLLQCRELTARVISLWLLWILLLLGGKTTDFTLMCVESIRKYLTVIGRSSVETRRLMDRLSNQIMMVMIWNILILHFLDFHSLYITVNRIHSLNSRKSLY